MLYYNDAATTEIYTLSLHDALPIVAVRDGLVGAGFFVVAPCFWQGACPALERERDWCHAAADWALGEDRKSTRLNSSHANISYAVFCLQKTKRERKLFRMSLIL